MGDSGVATAGSVFLSQCVEEQSSFFYQEWRAAKARTEALTFALAQYKVLQGVEDAVQSTSI
jgi:hypothetical protein